MIQLRPDQLRELLTESIRKGKPVLVQGAPGLGKTDIVTQSAVDAQADLVLSHPVTEDPTNTSGLPWMVDGHATFIPFGEMKRVLTATKPTVWFWDDLGQATPSVQSAKMQLLLARRINEHVLPDCVTILAATNRRADKANVSGMLEPVKSRFLTIVELITHVDDWTRWALAHDVAPELIAFMRFVPDLLCKFSATADLTNSPVPRTWSHVNTILGMTLSQEVRSAAIAGAVGEGAAVEFLAFLKLYQALPNIDNLLLNPTTAKYPVGPATLYALSCAMAYKATLQNFGSVCAFAERMAIDGHGEFGVLLARIATQRKPELANTTAMVRLVTGEVGELFSGK